MNIITIKNILKGYLSNDSEITVFGWVRTRRDSKIGISFLTIYDGSCFDSLQIIINSTLCNYKNDILNLTTGCSVMITGLIIQSIGKNQNIEVHAKIVKVLGWIDDSSSYPMSSKYHSLKHLRDFAHLCPRTNIIGAITRVRHILAQAIHSFMHENGFFWVPTPLITSSDTEGTSEMFRVSTLDLKNLPYSFNKEIDYTKDFFGKKSFLTVSGQLNIEAYACALSKVYTFGPTFRAEHSNTNRHLSEFWMIEPEVAFANLENIIELSELFLKNICKSILDKCSQEMKFFTQKINKQVISRLEKFINYNFIYINYTEVVHILETCGKIFDNPVFWGMDFSAEHEHYLTEKYFVSPIVVMNYPKDIKAFYMRLNSDGKTVAAMDILVPGIGEIVGGSQREERLNYLDNRLEEIGLHKENYWWYRDLRRYGTVPHSGFGLGFERLISYITGMQNIRDVVPFPRYQHNISF